MCVFAWVFDSHAAYLFKEIETYSKSRNLLIFIP